MVILKRQDVKIITVNHKDQQVPILTYQGQTFRLIKIFSASQPEEALNLWRDLTDHQGKACVLLREDDRHSIWGKVHLEQAIDPRKQSGAIIQAILLITQAVYADLEDMLGARQMNLFSQELAKSLNKAKIPHVENLTSQVLSINPLTSLNLPAWEESHLVIIMQELYRVAKLYFGNSNFAQDIRSLLRDLPEQEDFCQWLDKNGLVKFWHP